jgi:RNase P/RNase MRP subunit p29
MRRNQINLNNNNNNNNNDNDNDNNTFIARAAAQTMIDGRIVDSTKKQYNSNIKRMKKWYEKTNKEFVLPLHQEDVMTYFGSLIIIDPEDENKQAPAFFSMVL